MCERDDCQEVFFDRVFLRDHIRWHYGLEPLGTSSPDEEFALSELEEAPPKSPAPVPAKPEYKCEREDCGELFHDRDSIRDHVRQHYGLQPLDDTGAKVGEDASVFEQLETSFSAEKSASKRLHRYVCKYRGCGQKFSSLHDLRWHASSHPRAHYICERDDCKELFFDRDAVQNHVRRHHGLEPLPKTPAALEEERHQREEDESLRKRNLGIRDKPRADRKSRPVVVAPDAFYVCARDDCQQKFTSRAEVADHIHRHFEADSRETRRKQGIEKPFSDLSLWLNSPSKPVDSEVYKPRRSSEHESKGSTVTQPLTRVQV